MSSGLRLFGRAIYLLLAIPAWAHAAPHDGYALSNDAALRGGAALVLGRDAGSVWYNPAAIAATRRVRLDALAAAYGFKRTRVPGALQARVSDHVVDVTGREDQIIVVPTAISIVFAWPKRRINTALSFHTPVYADTEARMTLAGRNETAGYDFAQQANVITMVRRYHAGLSLAWDYQNRFRIGATVSVVYQSDFEFIRLVSSATDPVTGALSSYVGDVDAASAVGGIDIAIGVQGELTPWLLGGAMVRAPAGVVYSSFEGGQTISFTRRDPTGATVTQTTIDPSETDPAPRFLTPWTIAVGLALRLPKFDLELDAEASTAKLRMGSLWQRRGVWNVRLGGAARLSKRWILGAGLFTDRTTELDGDVFPDVVVNRWGGSIAVRFLTPVKLAKSERVRTLVFETTIAARYAMGVGTSGVLSATYPASGPNDVTLDTDEETRASQQLLTAHVGTGLRF